MAVKKKKKMVDQKVNMTTCPSRRVRGKNVIRVDAAVLFLFANKRMLLSSIGQHQDARC